MRIFDRREILKMAGLGIPAASVSGIGTGMDSFCQEIGLKERSGPWLEIHLANISWNVEQLRKRVKGRPIMAVVKANAYGLGLPGVARFLQDEGIDYLAVAGACSAIGLREAGITKPVLNLGPYSEAESGELVKLGITQSVYTDRFAFLNKVALKQGTQAKVHVKIDTGLGRLGVPYYEALPFIRKINSAQGLKIEGIFTALTEEEGFDKEQLSRFLKVCETAKQEGIDIGLRHAASSAGILDFPEAHLDMVRPGITIYGHYPSEQARQERKIILKPALQVKAPVLYVKTLRPGDGVSYHRPFVAEEETRVATIGIGYSDGYPRTVVNKGDVLIKGKRFPLIASITSNHMTANLQGDKDIEIGEEVVLIGNQGTAELSAEEVAEHAGISVYQLLIQMNPLLPRRYVHAGA